MVLKIEANIFFYCNSSDADTHRKATCHTLTPQTRSKLSHTQHTQRGLILQ